MTEKRQRISLGIAVGLAVAALAAVLFVPGIGCGSKDVKNIHGQANLRAASRHKYDKLTQFLDGKRKQIRAQKAKTTAATTKKSPRELTAYRTGVAAGTWQRYIWTPAKHAANGTLTAGKLKIAQKAAVSLNHRLELLQASASQANLGQVATAAAAARTDIGAVQATLAAKSFDPKVLGKEDQLIKQLTATARKAGLKVMLQVPPHL
jgi:gas vesicle protein